MRVASSGHATTCCSSSLSLYVAVVVAEYKKKINLVKKTHSNEKKHIKSPDDASCIVWAFIYCHHLSVIVVGVVRCRGGCQI
jgi:hypothetical protein